MDKKSIVLGVSLLVLIVVGMFGYSYFARQSAESDGSQNDNGLAQPEPILYPEITRIDAKHFYADGTHTIVGSLIMPTPCDVLTAEASVAESFPEQVALAVSVLRTDEMCAQVLSEQRFLVTASASEAATFRAEFMGRPVQLNLIPASPGETPETVEIFEKG